MLTPACEVRWAKIAEPDYRYATAQDPRGTYSIQVLVDPSRPRDAAFLEELKAEWERGYEVECRKEGKKRLATHDFPWTPVTDADGEDTGILAIRPKNKESFVDNNGVVVKVDIPVLDATKKRVAPNIGNGSTCRVAFDLNPFYTAGKYGLQLRLRAIQVLALVEYDPFGFDEEESGFVGEAYEPPDRHGSGPTERADPAPAAQEEAPPKDDNFASAEDELPF